MDKKVYVGIDVSKDRLDVAVRPSGKRWEAANDEEGVTELAKRVKGLGPALVVLEATGGLETLVVSALVERALPVAVVNPRQVRDFAKAVGRLAKTDALDAEVLAPFAEAVRPEVRPLKRKEVEELSALLRRRRQVVDMLTAEKNRLSREPSREIRKEIKKHIAWLQKRLDETDKTISKGIQNSPIWRAKDELLRSVPGVGPVLSAVLLAGVPELGGLDRRRIASLVGVAPLNNESGLYRGRRRVWGGRADVRSILYMATLAAVRCNPVIREFHERLRGSGKAPKLALTACMRKLLTILNAMVRDSNPWVCVS